MLKTDTRGFTALLMRGAPIIVFIFFTLVGLTAGNYHLNVGVITFLTIILAISLRLVMVAGEAALCWGAFYAMGAYATGILTTDYGLSFWATVPIGGLVAGVGAVVIGLPSLRTTGAYFLLMTFGFMIVLHSLLSVWKGLTGGFSGIQAIPRPTGVQSLASWYWLTLGLMLVTYLAMRALDKSRWGIELRALGQSRELSQSIGIAAGVHILAAFIVGALFAGVAGAFYASYVSFISPASFTFWVSVTVLMAVIVGGAKYLAGPVIGALVLQILPVTLNWSERYVAVLTAAVALGILMLMPKGIVTEVVDRLPSLARLHQLQLPAVSPTASQGKRTDTERRPRRVGAMSVKGLSKQYGGVRALDDVSFDIHANETLGIIGPNGAGKTTLFNVISGFTRPDSGTVLCGHNDVTGHNTQMLVGLGIARTFQHTSVFDEMTAFENVVVARRTGRRTSLMAKVFRPIAKDREALDEAARILDRFRLRDWANTPSQDLPYGVRKRLGVAIALATDPAVLFLDEPMAGLTDVEVEEMVELLRNLQDSGSVTIVIIEHRMAAVTSLCNRLVVLDFGKVIAEGDVEGVMRDPRVLEAYLGTPMEAAPHA